MDVVQDWATYLLGEHAGTVPYGSYVGQAYDAIATVKSWLLPLVDQVTKKPDLATIALLLIIALVSLKILDMLWQTVVFWIRMVRWIVFWGALVGLALWMYTRGPDGVADDVQYWYQKWNHEYQYWKEQEQVARRLHQQYGHQGPARWF